MEKLYFDLKDLKKFGKIIDFQEEMGKKFFDWYGIVFNGDMVFMECEKLLIVLVVVYIV